MTKLVYVAEFERMNDAIAWEKAIKGKSKEKRWALIAERNPRWNDLAWNWYGDEAMGGEAMASPSSALASLRTGIHCCALNDGS